MPIGELELCVHVRAFAHLLVWQADDASKVDVDEAILRHLAQTAHAVINPMAAIIGGIVGQEVRSVERCWAASLALRTRST